MNDSVNLHVALVLFTRPFAIRSEGLFCMHRKDLFAPSEFIACAQ